MPKDTRNGHRMPREPYDGQSLQRLFNPKSIAVVGVSSRETSFGARFVQNLYAYEGKLFLINPKQKELYGRPCYPSLAELPEVPDCVLIATDLKTVEPIFEECIRIGAGGAVVIASGFAETGDAETAAIQDRLTKRAGESGVRLAGPNTIGFVNYNIKAAATFLTDLDFHKSWDQPSEKRKIGYVSQSGALGFSFSQASQRGVYFSTILTCGNSADVNLADCINYFVEDPGTTVIGALLEGMPHPRQIEAAVRNATAAGKPVILYKMAKGEEGARAAASHTGNLAGSQAAYRTMVERAGGIFVDTYEELFEITAFFSKLPGAPVAEGTAVIATSGGAAIMAADSAELAGVPLPQPSREVTETLKSRIPEFGSARNPCDVTAQVINDADSMEVCIRAVLSDPQYNSVIVPQVLAYAISLPRLELMNRLSGETGKPIIVPWITAWREGPGALEVEEAEHLVMSYSMDTCFKALKMWTDWHARRKRTDTGGRVSDPSVAAAVGPKLAGESRTLAEREAKAVLAAYGVPVVGETAAASAAEARAVAERLGTALVMKIDSPDLAHKTEVGGIALNLKTPEAVAQAYDAMMARVGEKAPHAKLDGVLLQPMIPQGVEIVVGATVDDAFGPLVVVGLGGVLVELIKDSVAAPAPVTPMQAEDMLRSLRAATILDGFRDLPPVDVAKLSEIVARVSEFAADHADRIAELDVNPLICRGGEIVAVDALIVTAAAPTASATAHQAEPA